ncbi:hypothetical protein [Geodermatophilus marinus]|uniref:hypothetical protein n=1 Tax=Geodermatophilus sp. LHW52908 TaxID=2303986 RepID=UPI000E3D7DD2|nr:hypothetical protein [Geodermatophilus sp. LHW52908]RFU21919.1 hypothetical protein D0Z06_07210 [Geodermatophilus sp. LHW52908]
MVIGQFSIATALAFYLGWVRSAAYYGYFGLSTSMVGLSTSEYVLGSVGALYLPLMGVGLATALVTALHPRVVALLRRLPSARSLLPAGRAVGWGLVALAAAGFFAALAWRISWGRPAIPWLITWGAGLLAYLELVRSSLAGRRSGVGVQLIALAALALGGVFWLLGDYAGYAGRAQAREDAATIAYRTDVTVYSAQQLALGGRAGIVEDVARSEGGAYRFRYTNLRLLVYAGDRYFLLPVDWRHNGADPVIVLSPSETIRVELIGSPFR